LFSQSQTLHPTAGASDAFTIGVEQKHYSNDGNGPLLDLLDDDSQSILDVGCGAGDNARLSRRRGSVRQFYGITASNSEYKSAAEVMADCWCADIESSDLGFLRGKHFDALLFSHTLEHLREPARVLSKFTSYLSPGGLVLIAVPNVLEWRQRFEFLRGRFEYQDAGILDASHLRFFTFDSADRYLLRECPNLTIEEKVGDGSVPLWFLRHAILPARAKQWLDKRACSLRPNLFAGQILIKARTTS